LSNESGPGFDPDGEAGDVLAQAVADFGVHVLSSASLLEGICEDRLPDFPREASLITSAARADVAAMLQQQAGTVGPDNAVRLTAATLAESYSFDPAACVWVVSEFARVLGYQVSNGIQVTGPPPRVPTPEPPPRPDQPRPDQPRPDQPGQDPRHTSRLPDGGLSGDLTEVPSEPATDRGQVIPSPRSRVPWQRFAAIGAVAVIALYFGVAGAAKLPPFAPKPTPTPTPAPTPRPDPTPPSPSPNVFVPNAADQSLMQLIPAKINTGGNCRAVQPSPAYFAAIAEVVCGAPDSVPVSNLLYYSFDNATRLDQAYRAVLHNVQGTEGKGICYDHGWEFSPVCETTYGPANSHTTEGHMVESTYRTTPYVSFTVLPDNMLVVASGPIGNGESVTTNGFTLVQWWQKYPWPWIAGG
jgi:hypothetical protein